MCTQNTINLTINHCDILLIDLKTTWHMCRFGSFYYYHYYYSSVIFVFAISVISLVYIKMAQINKWCHLAGVFFFTFHSFVYSKIAKIIHKKNMYISSGCCSIVVTQIQAFDNYFSTRPKTFFFTAVCFAHDFDIIACKTSIFTNDLDLRVFFFSNHDDIKFS